MSTGKIPQVTMQQEALQVQVSIESPVLSFIAFNRAQRSLTPLVISDTDIERGYVRIDAAEARAASHLLQAQINGNCALANNLDAWRKEHLEKLLRK